MFNQRVIAQACGRNALLVRANNARATLGLPGGAEMSQDGNSLNNCDAILDDDLPPSIAAMRDALMKDTAAFFDSIEEQKAELMKRWYQLGLYYVNGEAKTLVH